MNKEEAAEFLGCSLRTLERYMQQGKITFRYKKGKTRQVAVFDEQELERFREQLGQATIKPAVEPRQTPPQETHELATLNHERSEVEQLARIIEMLLTTQTTRVRISEKLILTLDESRQLSGLSKQHLRRAIASGHLKAQKLGKGWKIKRQDLEKYVSDL